MNIPKSLIMFYMIMFVIFTISLCDDATENDRPIIGLITTPSDYPSDYDSSQYSYFRASYVKWIESGGSRVSPISWNMPQDKLLKLLGDINGVVIPSGLSNLVDSNGLDTPYTAAIRTIINYAIAQNKQGTYYPVFGINQGFQAISLIISNNPKILQSMNFLNKLGSLKLTGEAYNGKVLSLYPDYLIQYTQTDTPFWFNQTNGIYLNVWNLEQNLTNYFNILSTTFDNSGDEFVSMIEGKSLPIFGVQFHPERSAFDWDEESYNHDYNAVKASQLLINSFIDQCRNNQNGFPTPVIEDGCLIYNSNTTILPQLFTQLYFFPTSGASCLDQMVTK